MAEGEVIIRLSGAEALVLFEFLTRFNLAGQPAIEHPAEQQVLWNAQCLLEKELEEPLEHNYAYLLEQARKEILS